MCMQVLSTVGVQCNERKFPNLREVTGLGGGCHLPVGAIAGVSGDHLSLCGVLGSLDGENLVRLSAEGPRTDSIGIGTELSALIRKTGGEEILAKLDAGLNT